MSEGFEVFLPEHLTKDEIESLWDQEVDMDDWDYLLVIPEGLAVEREGHDWKGKPRNYLIPEDYRIQRLMRGHDPKWYKVTFRGKQVAIGVSYH